MKTAFVNFAKSFLSNLKTIIFALILAVIIWFAISFQLFPNVPRTIQVTVSSDPTMRMLDDRLELAHEFDEIINVEIEGKRYDIGRLTSDDFYAYLDFSEVREPGEHEVDIVIESRVDEKFVILNRRNQTHVVNIIQTSEESLKIIPTAQDLQVEDFFTTIDYTNLSVTPEEVIIWGEKSLIDSVRSAQVVPLSDVPLSAVPNARGEFVMSLPGRLVLLDNDGNAIEHEGINIEDRAFTVTVPLFKRKMLPLKMQIEAQDNFNLNSLLNRMSITPGEVLVASNSVIIDEFDSIDVKIPLSRINLNELNGGRVQPIEMPHQDLSIVPDDSTVTNDNSVQINFNNISDYKRRSINVPLSNFNIEAPSGYDVLSRSLSQTQTITVQVVGPSNAIDSIEPDDIGGTVNLTAIIDNIPAGVWEEVTVKFTLTGSNVRAWVIENRIEIMYS
jgi:YbbR domain-containing protein